MTRVVDGRLYQFTGITHGGSLHLAANPFGEGIPMRDTRAPTPSPASEGDHRDDKVVQRVKEGDVLLVLGHVRELVTSGDWWLHVLCNGVPGYVKKRWIRGHLTEVKQ